MTIHSCALFLESMITTNYVFPELNHWEVDNNVGKVIYLDGVANQFDVGTNATSMKEYAQQMKYPLEEATITLQPLQQLGEELKQIPLPIMLFYVRMMSRYSRDTKTGWWIKGADSPCRSPVI